MIVFCCDHDVAICVGDDLIGLLENLWRLALVWVVVVGSLKQRKLDLIGICVANSQSVSGRSVWTYKN